MDENPIVYELVDDEIVIGSYNSMKEAEKALSGYIDPPLEIRARRLSGFDVYTPEQAVEALKRLSEIIPVSTIARSLGLSRLTVKAWIDGKTSPKLKATHHLKILSLSRAFLN